MTDAYLLGLGSCLGNRHNYLNQAVDALKQLGNITRYSKIYESPAELPEHYAGPDHPDYLNAAIQIHTPLSPIQLLQQTQIIERALGRPTSNKLTQEPRTLDIDLLVYQEAIIHLPNLIIPHPRMWLRAFAIFPAADCWPDWHHPLHRDTLIQRRDQLNKKKVNIQTCSGLTIDC